MIDIHCHILYGIDDGARTKQETIDLLKQQKELGFNEIVLTPHYIENTEFEATIEKKEELIKELEEETDVKLYIGNEVYFSDKTINLLDKVSTLNNSKYLLIELPMSSKIKDLEEMIFDLTVNKIVPIIAHPERYSYVQDDIKYLDHLKELGVLFQVNYGSLIGKYGKKCEKTAKKLLKKNYISFMGTDIHRIDRPIDMEKALNVLKKVVKKQEIVDDLTTNNIKKVIENKYI
ncbi:MAG: protein tyrosine phosphatase [Bacilli bacterium]|nr:protein tyrosine phosphatase [Bacilli bacterium]